MWNVDIPTKDELLAPAQVREVAVVSIYLPTTPATLIGDTVLTVLTVGSADLPGAGTRLTALLSQPI